jgi:hypothetical protein
MDSNFIEKKEAKSPSKEEIKFSKTLEGKVCNHINDCLKKKNLFEAYMFSWALVEQVLLNKLINFIAKNLRVKIPSSLWRSNQLSINNFYLAISHDKDLYLYLEKGRKARNKIIHKLVKTHNIGTMRKEILIAFDHVLMKIIDPIFARLSGKTPIPSLGLYAKGWNDCRQQMIKNVEKHFSTLT